MKVLVAQLCLTLCDPMDCIPPDSSVHGILHGASRAAPGKSGLHARGEGERILALESRVTMETRSAHTTKI